MGFTLTDILLFGSATTEDSGVLTIFRKQMLEWGAIGRIVEVVVSGIPPLVLPDAIAGEIPSLKAFGGTEYVAENYIDSVTVDGKCEQNNLPSGYTQYDSLIGDGDAYIDLDCVLDQDDEIEIDFMKTSNIASRNVFGGRESATSNNISVIVAGTGNAVADFNNSDYAPYRVNASMSQNVMYKVIVNKTGRYVYNASGTLIDSNTTACTDTITTPGCCLFYLAGAGLGRKFVGVVYKCVVKNKRDCVPAYNGTEYGMYDKISGRFFTNANEEGTFTAGNVVVPTPDAPMDIWCNNGVLKLSPNLFDKSKVPNTNTYINKSNGAEGSPTGTGEYKHSDYTLIEGNTQYYVGMINSGASTAGLAFYDNTQTYISGVSLSQLGFDNNIITSPANAKYIRFTFRIDEGYNSNWENTVYLVKGNQPLENFIPYGQIYADGTAEVLTDDVGNTASVANVLSCGNVKDTQEILTGAVTRNVGIKVLDGTESFTNWTNGNGFFTLIADAAYQIAGVGLCNCAPNVDSITNFGVRFGAGTGNQYIYFVQWKTALNITTVDEFQQWLSDQYNAGTPVIIVYPLATPTTESVAGQFLTKTPVTQTAGSLTTNITTVATDHTVPTPTQPLDINCNNGVLKARHESGLPLGYTLLDYIQSSGSQYIDTLRVPNNDDIIEQKFQKVGGSDTTCSWYGSMPSSQTITPRIGIGSFLQASVPTLFAGSNYTGAVGAANTNVHTLRFQATGEKELTYTLDGVTNVIAATPSTNMYEPAIELTSYLFARHGTNGVQVYDNEGTRIYYHREYLANGTLVLNMVPCKNASNVLGMYDFVSGQFFVNQGTGNFTAGDPVSDPVEIYTDGTVETLGIICNNLVEGGLKANINSSGQVVSNNSFAWYAPVTPGETYTYKNPVLYAFFTEKPQIGSVSYNNSRTVTPVGTFTVPNDPSIKYVGFRNNSDGGYCVKGSVLYAGGTATCEDLLSIGTYTDEQEVISGGVTRKVGVKVLDGTENWGLATAWGTHAFSLPRFDGGSGIVPLICSHNNNYAGSSIVALNNQCTIRGGSFILSNNNYTNTSATDFKTWLADQYAAGTPVIVVYPLATSTTETVTGQTLQVQDGDNVLEITQASMSGLELSVTYKAGVVLTVEEVEDAQLSPDVEVIIQ